MPRSGDAWHMPLSFVHRGRLVGFAGLLYAVALASMLLLEDVPSLGIAYFLYLPIALVALATSPLSGAAAGVVAAEVYAIGELLATAGDHAEMLSPTAGLRLLTYTSIGALVGKFAADHREFTSRLRALAERDPLTGLLNARAHETALARRLATRDPFALVLVDLDGLKELNDEFGHAAGNETLQRLAATLAGAVRRGDTVARIGGDEFAVLVGGAGDGETGILCSRLERRLTTSGMPASIGYAVWPDDGTDARTLFERADERLYARKAERRATASAGGAEPGTAGVPAEAVR